MKVRECMTTDPSVCVAESSCAAAGEIMRRYQCEAIPVVDDLKTKRVVGVVTDRDLMLHLVRQPPAHHSPVKACMTTAPMLISADAELEEAIEVMKRAAMRQLPVVENGILVGVLSLLDIALAVRRQWAYVGPNVTEQRVTEIIEAIAMAQAAAQNRPGLRIRAIRVRSAPRRARAIVRDGHTTSDRDGHAKLARDGHVLPRNVDGKRNVGARPKRKAR